MPSIAFHPNVTRTLRYKVYAKMTGLQPDRNLMFDLNCGTQGQALTGGLPLIIERYGKYALGPFLDERARCSASSYLADCRIQVQ
jgi:hypothetical protein